jgi:phospholipid/cholesterol/gamma-HCH transport system substrate-binding protein
MVNNPDLYQNLNRASINVEELSRQLRPILNDVRVFTDKIARHPESLGVRGAIKPDQGTKW